MKKVLWGLGISTGVLVIVAFLLGRFAFPNTALPGLPAPELAEGERGALGIDKNINESTIDSYLGRADSAYIDLRMLKDPGDYELIGGDSYLSGFVNGFEVVPFPYIVNVSGLPESVGDTYTGETLFTEKDGVYKANYAESLAILENLFPKDKVLFLMCGGGGYSGMMKKMLVTLGWDETRIYDVGGYWFYEGANNVSVKRTRVDGTTVYDFYKVPYHEIDFSELTSVPSNGMVKISAKSYDKMIKEKQSFVVFVDQDGCHTAERLREFAAEYNQATGLVFERVMFADIKETKLYESVKYYPSVAVIKNGEVVTWLKADSDEDAARYNDYEEFKNWLDSARDN